MKIKIKPLCWDVIPVVLFSFALFVTSCRQEEFAGEENVMLKSAVIPELTLTYPSKVIPGHDFEIKYSSTCGKVMIERGYINGDPIMEGDIIIGFEKVYNGLTCDTEFLQWESIGNNGFLPCSGGKITGNWSIPGTYVYRAKLNHKTEHKSGCTDCATFKGNQFECFMIRCFFNLRILPPQTFMDVRDEKIYRWVEIGNQVWMAENLAYLPSVSPPTSESATDPYYYVYDYFGINISTATATANYSTYGVLYNWPAALTACPSGWHLPSDSEWLELTNYLIINGYGYGGSSYDIAKALAAKTNWNFYEISGTPGNDPASNNSSGFSGLPGGSRNLNGNFYDIGDYGFWWSSTEYSTALAWSRYLYYYDANVSRYSKYLKFKVYGFSVRCVRD